MTESARDPGATASALVPAPGGRYTVVGPLGRGGMGVVLRVLDAKREQEVALKRMNADGPQARLRFKREFRELVPLLHPNLVRLYELGEDGDGLFFTMEAVEGTTLWDVLCPTGDHGGVGPSTPTLSCETVDAPEWPPETAASPTMGGGPWQQIPQVLDQSAGVREESGTVPARLPVPPPAAAGPAWPSTGAAPSDAAADRSTLPLTRPPPQDPGVAAPPPHDQDAHLTLLRTAAPQLVEALRFLHAHDLLHRDLKPQNVMLTPDGVVKVLDFGMLARLGHIDAATQTGAGTPGFMAPEQIRGDPPTPWGDLYGLGATLYFIASGGRPPYRGSTSGEILWRQLHEPPTAIETWSVAVPRELASLIHRLLSRRPENRPSLAEVAGVLAGASGDEAARPAPGTLFGRAAERLRIRHHLDRAQGGGFSALILEGHAGLGKTRLLAWAEELARKRGCRFLAGRGRCEDRVTYNAMDGAVDDLAVQLAELPPAEVARPAWTEARAAAATIFPVLARVSHDPEGAPLPRVSRQAAFDGLVTVIGRLAECGSGVVLAVDDLQWADADSLWLLSHLVSAQPPGVLVLATQRPDTGAGWPPDDPRAELLCLAPLGDDEVHAIARVYADRSWPDAGALAAVCGGNALLAELAGKRAARGELAATDTGASLLRGHVGAAAEAHGPLLALLTADDGWVGLGALGELLGAPRGIVDDALRHLEGQGIVRTRLQRGEAAADLYHDTVRGALLELLHAEALRAAHDRLADHAMRHEAERPERVARHLLAAGRSEEVGPWALRAADRAEHQKAWSLASDMVRAAIDVGASEALALWRRCARDLMSAGRFVEAADAWLRVEWLDGGGDAREAVTGQAFALLAAHRVDDGYALLERILPPRPRGTLGWGLAVARAIARYLRGPIPGELMASSPSPPPSPPSPWSGAPDGAVRLALIAAYYDPTYGLVLLTEARRELVARGPVEDLCQCDLVLAYFAEHTSGAPTPRALSARYRDSARRAMESLPEVSPRLRAMDAFLGAVQSLRTHRLGAVGDALDDVLRQWEDTEETGCFEHTYCLMYRAWIGVAQQRCDLLAGQIGRLERTAAGSSDIAVVPHLKVLRIIERTWQGDLAGARAAREELRRLLPAGRQTIQGAVAGIYGSVPDLYDTDCHGAAAGIARVLGASRRFRVLASSASSLLASLAALVEVNALRTGWGQGRVSRVERHAAIALGAVPLVPSWALRALAYAADVRGRPERAVAHLRTALDVATARDQPLDEAVSAWQLGGRLGGDEGGVLQARAVARLEDAGGAELLLHEDAGRR